jgi:uncharacterized membrane protein YesL
MSDLFKYGSPFMQKLDLITNYLLLNLLMLISALPIITLGTTLITGVELSRKMLDKQAVKVWRDYWTLFKTNSISGLFLGIQILAIGGLLVVDWLFVNRLPIVVRLLVVVLLFILSVGAVLLCTTVIPYAARYNDSFRHIWKNALLISIQKFPWVILASILLVLPLIFLMAGVPGFVTAIYWLTFIGFGAYAFGTALIFRHVFNQLETRTEVPLQ